MSDTIRITRAAFLQACRSNWPRIPEDAFDTARAQGSVLDGDGKYTWRYRPQDDVIVREWQRECLALQQAGHDLTFSRNRATELTAQAYSISNEQVEQIITPPPRAGAMEWD